MQRQARVFVIHAPLVTFAQLASVLQLSAHLVRPQADPLVYALHAQVDILALGEV
jgi:hypothetical protein